MNIPREFIEYIEKNCYASEFSGYLLCKKCNHRVNIDWFEKELTCSGCDEL